MWKPESAFVVAAVIVVTTVAAAAAETNAYRVAVGDDWVPIDFCKGISPGSALDFSGLGLVDAPAGKHGWLKSVNGHFAFADSPDVPRRFYGPNLVFDGCCPVGDDAEMLADRLVRLGYNSVRLHGWETALSMGDEGWTKKWDEHVFAPEKLDRFDRLAAACIRRGIYLTTDLFVSRNVVWGDVGERMGNDAKRLIRPQALYKSLILLDERGFADWCGFARKFLTHRNPYTGRTYAEEPGMPLISLVNECCFSGMLDKLRAHPLFRAEWKRWLAEERTRDPVFAAGLSDDLVDAKLKGDSVVVELFEAHLESRFFRRAAAFLRNELGVKALLTNQNIGVNHPPIQRVREELYDYVDVHQYDSHPAPRKGFVGNSEDNDPTQVTWMGGPAKAATMIVGKPFTVSEWDYCYPSRYRASAGLLTGSLAAMQEYGALWRYGWVCSLANRCDELKDEHVFKPRPFSALTDPIGLATDRMAVLLYLRGDVKPLAEPGDCLRLTAGAFNRADGISPRSDKAYSFGNVWHRKFRQVVSGPVPKGWREISYEEGEASKGSVGVTHDPSAAFLRNPTNRSLTVSTERTCGGFAFPESGAVQAGDLVFRLRKSFAAVSVSAVDGAPIASSRRLLVMHLTNLQAEGSEFADKTFRAQLKQGEKPVVADGEADLSVRVEHPECFRVWALDTSGRRLVEVPAKVLGGRLAFTACVRGADGKARLYYEAVAAERRGDAAWRPAERWRGFNLLGMFLSQRHMKPPATDPTWSRTPGYFAEQDFRWMHEWGFNFARLPLDYRCWIRGDDWNAIDEGEVEKIDDAIRLGRKYGIHVQLCLHRAPGFCINPPKEPRDLFHDSEAFAVCAAHWRMFARRYRGIPNRELSFDLFNEPNWWESKARTNIVRVVRGLYDTIRAEDPERMIVADGYFCGRDPITELGGLTDLVQSIHAYEPPEVSHYRAEWRKERDLTSVQWPPDGVTDGVQWLRERFYDPWFKLRERGVYLYVGETGVYKNCPHDVALRFMEDKLRLWKSENLGWCLWNLRGTFGIVDSERADVAYEDFEGHKLDRRFLTLLQNY